MNTKTLILAGTTALGALGVFSSCKSHHDAMYKNALNKQYEQIYNDKNIMDNFGVSTLKSNGRLSCIEGNDVLYFATEGDSSAYYEMNFRANGIVKKAEFDNQNSLNSISNTYIRSKTAANEYYNTATKNPQSLRNSANLDINYRNSIQNIEQNQQILYKEATKANKKRLKNAYKQIKKIINNARKKLDVIVCKKVIKPR